MSEYVDFHYMPLEGKITGKQVLKQTEDAINDLGNKVYNLDIDQSEIDEAIEKSNEAINTANSALAAVTTGRSVWFNNVAEMIASDIEAGVTAETKGYHVANDGGNALYLIRQEKSGDVVDGGSLIALDNGNMAELVTDGTVNVRQFGAIGNGTDDDTTVFQNTSSYAQANGFVPFVGVATYKITSNITGTFNSFGEVTITGGGTVDIINLQEVVSDVSDIRDEVVDETASAKAYSESAATSATNASNSASSASTTATQLMAYLETKETLTAPAVDPTLFISGAAADAKVTGDNLKYDTSKTFGSLQSIVISQNNVLYPISVATGNVLRVAPCYTDTFSRANAVSVYRSDQTKITEFGVTQSDKYKNYTATEDISYVSVYYEENPIVVTTGKTSSLSDLVAEIVPVSTNKVTFSKSGTSWVISIPKYLALLTKKYNEPFSFVTLANAMTVTIPSGGVLIYDYILNTFTAVTDSANIDFSKPYLLVLYNSYGVLQGQWAKYCNNDYALKSISAKSKKVVPISSLQVVFKRNANNSFTVIVPTSVAIIDGIENTYTIKNFEGTYTVNGNSYLVYNAKTDALETYTDITLPEDEDITILLFNSYGVLHGQWAGYANSENFAYKTGHVKMVAHQGSGLISDDGIGHSLIGAYVAAWQAGFEMAETDVVFSSDNVPVCCHDDTFVDTNTSSTITIAEHTFAELQTYGYYGGTISSLDDIIKKCKTLGLDLQIDHIPYNITDTQWTNITNSITKYRMQEHIQFIINQSLVQRVQSYYPNARILLLATSMAELASQIAVANSIVTDLNEVVVSFNYGITNTTDIVDYILSADKRVKFSTWLINFANVALEWFPYVDYITSDKISNKVIFDYIN